MQTAVSLMTSVVYLCLYQISRASTTSPLLFSTESGAVCVSAAGEKLQAQQRNLTMDYDRFYYNTRLAIFFIFAECSGWAALVWALVVLHHHRKNNGRIPALVTIVLLNNVLELLLNPYIITKLIQDNVPCDYTTPCRILLYLWGTSVICGVLLQQMMVLESVLTLRYPSCSDHVFFTSCFIILYILAFICIFLCVFYLYPLLLLTVIPLVSINMISWIVVCRKPPNEHSSNRTKKPDLTLLAFTTNTLIIYLISLFLGIFTGFWGYIFFVLLKMSLCVLSLRLMVDPLLCVLVCKQKKTVETEQPEETEES
ncbi:uncharacterized protein LOC111188285 isoform X2 [Astyanax mexicanus]|uniref:uncharacterized protein LOC111188285 isoform X1 n=1 Tax=Astyanax mexicanus TaxID=7994 RepID=UPI0020CAD5D6|nr:uncharacterized protein LOC111188285 isoform X1 [Astyanax mexicanus]XP_049328363.1 uncharacterized protein LOC111188285 isoform X2 [Astyanax mexicanus]